MWILGTGIQITTGTGTYTETGTSRGIRTGNMTGKETENGKIEIEILDNGLHICQ